MTHVQKINTNSSLFLIIQPGDAEIDYYSLIPQVPRHREATFIRASVKAKFAASDFGTILYYTTGEMSLEAANQKAAALLS